MCRWIGGSVLINNHFEGGKKLHVTPCTPFPVLGWVCLFILEGTEYLLCVGQGVIKSFHKNSKI